MTKYYYAGSLRIAMQRRQNAQFAALPDDAVRLAAAVLPRPVMILVLRHDVQIGAAASVLLLAAGLALAPWKRRPVVGIAVRHGHVIGVALAFTASSLPWPVVVRPAEAQCAGPPPAGQIFHYHVDHLGSTQLITTSTGAVQEWIRYLPYGEIWGRYNSSGARINPADERFRYEFTGYETEFRSGLQYAGARFYDPDLGMFLTHDPARQFPNPYAYGPWNPINGTDPTGGFWLELLIAAVVAAAASAAVNTVIAAAQGLPLNQIGNAAAMGAVTGAVGVGLGVIAAGISISLSAVAGTLPQNVGWQQALNALGEVAYRSAFSTTVANAAGEATSAAGAPGWLSTLASIGAGYGSSVYYDQALLDPSGDLARIEVKGDYRQVSNTRTHSDITTKAAAAAVTGSRDSLAA